MELTHLDIAKAAFTVCHDLKTGCPRFSTLPAKTQTFWAEQAAYIKLNPSCNSYALHQRWRMFMGDLGWNWGESFDELRKLDPRIISYEELKPEDQMIYRTLMTLFNLFGRYVR